VALLSATSLAGLLVAQRAGWPLWGATLAVGIPWLPPFAVQVLRMYRCQPWLGCFYLLTATQLLHFGEHLAQMVQMHVLGLTGAGASGVFGALNIEWVHFAWNSLVILGVLVLLTRYPGNRWLWLTALISGWHIVEHTYILSVYLGTGISGTPGLLSRGGLLGGGLPLVRADLHFVYNLVETAPLVAAFPHAAYRLNTVPTSTRRRNVLLRFCFPFAARGARSTRRAWTGRLYLRIPAGQQVP
jgi:hypothetical protein